MFVHVVHILCAGPTILLKLELHSYSHKCDITHAINTVYLSFMNVTPVQCNTAVTQFLSQVLRHISCEVFIKMKAISCAVMSKKSLIVVSLRFMHTINYTDTFAR